MQEASAGSLCMGCKSTSSLVIRFGALDVKNQVDGSQCRAIGSQTIGIMRSGSRQRAEIFNVKWRSISSYHTTDVTWSLVNMIHLSFPLILTLESKLRLFPA